MKVFIVTFNGYRDNYGSDIYLLGVYSSREKAEEACKKAVSDMRAINRAHPNDYYPYDPENHEPNIEEIDLDKSKPIGGDEYVFNTDICLGGYCE